MSDPYPEYTFSSTNETVTPQPVASVPVKKSMGAVEIGVIAVAVAITLLAISAAMALSKRR